MQLLFKYEKQKKMLQTERKSYWAAIYFFGIYYKA